MSSNILRLTRIHLKGSSGFSAAFSSKDDRIWKKAIGTLAAYVLVSAALVILLTLVSKALVVAGFAEYIPGFAATISVVFILILNIFKSGSTVFDLKLFETEAALPVTSFQIVASRFLVLYIVNLAITLVIMTPCLIVCGLNLPEFSVLFLVGSILGVLFLPLLPLTVSIAVGALLYAISARMKHRKLVVIILGLALMVAAFVVYFMFLFSKSSDTDLPTNLANLVMEQFGSITGWCVPATLLSDGIYGSVLSLLSFVAISIGFYLGLLYLISWKYLPICQAMQVKDAHHNYVMRDQEQFSVKKSLFRRDFKRYISSTTYVFNTLFGYILMVVLAVAVFCIRDAEMFHVWDEAGLLTIFCAFGLAFLASTSSTTSASISIEGKNWWITQTLPVTAKDIFSSKLKLNFAVAMPFYIIGEILLIIALKPSALEAIILILLPLVYIYFMSVFGLRSAVRHPKFAWSSEAEAVKQGIGLMFSILIAIGTLAVAFIAVIGITICFSGVSTLYSALSLCLFTLIILGVAALIHRKLNKTEIIDIIE